MHNTNSIPPKTRCRSKQEFTDLLRKWYDHTDERVIGGSPEYNQTPWLWVQIGTFECHLNADTKRQGVREYLERVIRYSAGLEWRVCANQNGKFNKVCFSPDAYPIAGFYLYVKPALSVETIIGEATIGASEPVSTRTAVPIQGEFPRLENLPESEHLMSFRGSVDHHMGDTRWRDVSSLRLDGHEWHMKPVQLSSEMATGLLSMPLKDAGGCRNAISIELGGTSHVCQIAITQRRENDGIGCRVMATAIERLTQHYGSVERVPEQIYIQARSGSSFRPGRSLLMLRVFADPIIRQDIFTNYSWSHIPTQFGEDHKEFETRAVKIVHDAHRGYEPVASSVLFLPGAQSRPDGLFTKTQSKELLVVEAKQRRPDFEEGAAQIMLYYAQAKYYSPFRDWRLRLRVVTSEPEPTPGYEIWQQWMRSGKKLNVFVVDTLS
jgi:hypothetical protein